MIIYTCTYVPEGLFPSQVQLIRFVVSQDEWKHWVLHQVIESSPSQLVELSEVLKISDFTLPPTEVVVSVRKYLISFLYYIPFFP